MKESIVSKQARKCSNKGKRDTENNDGLPKVIMEYTAEIRGEEFVEVANFCRALRRQSH